MTTGRPNIAREVRRATPLERAYNRFLEEPDAVVGQLKERLDAGLLRAAHDRMLELRGTRGVDDWRTFLGVVGVAQYGLICKLGANEFDAEDYRRAFALARWWANWSKGKRRAERVRGARVPGEPRPTVVALIERDGPTCWRCGEECETDPEVAFWVFDPETGRGLERNPRYRTVGHVIRLADGGTDTMSNARLECWECNSADGIPHPSPW
ncbi:HNH endonuclease [Cellulosimicrobium cellulans]|uniref:HNH endonuclease n=1 Tax=Cellulosimicrobium cellulans TaxID=1710 RepID=UPI00196544BB|nr:HNH endonuclease [Cellulosimicrobium cellulans]MBN0039406.1 HNH endonuclease [Cellulosimicrobium cellulans]